MQFALPLDEMTTADKLRVMEELWADLSRDETKVPAPSWHEDVLKEREGRISSGEQKFVDWETAKAELRNRLK
jgi:hypothetical protein